MVLREEYLSLGWRRLLESPTVGSEQSAVAFLVTRRASQKLLCRESMRKQGGIWRVQPFVNCAISSELLCP